MGSHETHMVPAADGRELEVLVTGPPDGFPLVFHRWTPGAAVPFAILERPVADRGLRVISYSRPGYGRSTPRADAGTTATVAGDAAILDHLGLGQFVTIGWFSGGPRPLACAAMLPGRCRAAASLASLAPHPRTPRGWTRTPGSARRTSPSTPRPPRARRRSRRTWSSRLRRCCRRQTTSSPSGSVACSPRWTGPQ